jgi:ATP-dependent DNA ligase
LLLGYYTDDGKLTYAGRVGTGMTDRILADLRRRLEPLALSKRLWCELLGHSIVVGKSVERQS